MKMKFTKIKIGDLQYIDMHCSVPCGMYMRLEGLRIPVGIEGGSLGNRVTASTYKYPIIDITLTAEEEKNIMSLCGEKEYIDYRVYIPGIGFVNPKNISTENNNSACKLEEG
jgi:hypothetical protein